MLHRPHLGGAGNEPLAPEQWHTSSAVFQLGDDSIFRCTVQLPEHTLAHARDALNLMTERTRGRKQRFAMLVDISQVSHVESEAQRHYASSLPTGAVCLALIIGSRWSRMIGNIAMSVAALAKRNKTNAVPLKLFDDMFSAEAWCRSMLLTLPSTPEWPATRPTT